MDDILALGRTIYRDNFSYFLERSFPLINNGIKYQHNWHIDAIAKCLTELERGRIKRLIINMPPRYLKSVIVSVCFPAWLLGREPHKRIIVASYSEKLALKHSTDCRQIIESEWYKNIFPNTRINDFQNQKYKFATTENGFRFATSVGGTLTGEGGDILIADDPHNPQQVMSESYRSKTLDWYANTFSSRLNDKKKGAIVIVMQRLHTDDLSGRLLAKGGWFHLNLPAIATEDENIVIGDARFCRKKGDVLHREREDVEELEAVKLAMGSYIFNAQYQQNPLVATSTIIKQEWFRRYNYLDMQKKLFGGASFKTDIKNVSRETFYLSFDTAIKIGETNDPTVCSVWLEDNGNYYLIDVIREWLEYPELKKLVLSLIEKWRPQAVLIEDKASGQSLLQDLKRETKENIIAINVKSDKLTRFIATTAMVEAGRIFLPDDATWLADFENELYLFPYAKHDDQVDSFSQFLNWIRNKGNNNIRIRRL